MICTAWLLSASVAAQAPEEASEVDRQSALIALEDQTLRASIEARLRALPGMDQVAIDVQGGLVKLSGRVAEPAQRELAATVAERAPSVLMVDNRIALDTDVGTRLSPLMAALEERARQLVQASPLLLAALAIVVLSWWLGGWLGRSRLLLARARQQPFLSGLLRQTIRIIVLILGLLLALDLLNATALLGALLGTAGIVGIAFGFAFRDVAENYIAGVLLSLRQPFLPRDHVVIDGHEGHVASLTSRATILLTPEGNHLRLPNALVFKAVILNYSRNPTRRFDFQLGVGNDEDLLRACQLARDTLTGIPEVLPQPTPTAVVAGAADSSMTLGFTGWIDQRESSFVAVRSEAIRQVKAAFDAAEIDMPDPGFRIETRPVRHESSARPKTLRLDEQQRDVLKADEPVIEVIERERAQASGDRLSSDGQLE